MIDEYTNEFVTVEFGDAERTPCRVVYRHDNGQMTVEELQRPDAQRLRIDQYGGFLDYETDEALAYRRPTDCRKCGQDAAWVHNKCASTGVIGTSELRRLDRIYGKLHDAAVARGREAFAEFAEGFEEAIDRSANSDWMLEHTS